jgi:hypothetical protein
MKRSVWSRDEIKDVLISAQRASALTARAMGNSREAHAQAYAQGFAAALVVMATAFGLEPAGRSPFDGDSGPNSRQPVVRRREWEEERW